MRVFRVVVWCVCDCVRFVCVVCVGVVCVSMCVCV